MENLRFLYLNSNKISTIEPYAFNGLVNLKEIRLQYNLIETFDLTLFQKPELERIDLSYNKIKSLSGFFMFFPQKLNAVLLRGNFCIDVNYSSNNLTQLQNQLEISCNRQEEFSNFQSNFNF